ncbi:excalibur calcium-binding domain-containing protein [Streptomyces sp. NPDC101150]|uniref:excalibur calcium-binding domain-containing protein n=1 Tax=Streptomyces sp. NPDC101150 TaxID=3366114 RepID=UPI0037FEDAC1
MSRALYGLNPAQKTTLGCGGMAAVAFVLLVAAAACSPAMKGTPTPSPTVTVTKTVTKTATPTPTKAPKAIGGTYDKVAAALHGVKVRAESAYSDVDLPGRSRYGSWKVCFQTPDASARIGSGGVTLYLGEDGCPDHRGDRLHKPKLRPKPKPTSTPAPDATSGGSSGGSSTSGGSTTGGGSSAYYPNCAAARAAGAAPIHAGEPGYGRHLDRDGDGIGCDT